MKKWILTLTATILIAGLTSSFGQFIPFENTNLDVINREIVSINDSRNTLILSRIEGDGMAIVNDLDFAEGTIELEIKGENSPGRSFVGVAFNIQNDSTYEAVYFRPFNFQS